MRILNLGSVNIDHVYQVDHFVRPGETLGSLGYHIYAGGKGFNQSIALGRAGADVRHAGKIGRDGEWLRQPLHASGVGTDQLQVCEHPTGHAIIQVAPSGENSIILHGGANQTVEESDIVQALAACSPEDILLLQNEISCVPEAMAEAHRKGLYVVFNPAPMSPDVLDYPLECVNLFILNETEAEGMTGSSQLDEIRRIMCERYPRSATVLTLGRKGAIFFDQHTMHQESAMEVQAVDTTAAGDTFIGFFLAEWMRSHDAAAAMARGCRAAALCVQRAGASDSIPTKEESM